jgi:hypothetical protein
MQEIDAVVTSVFSEHQERLRYVHPGQAAQEIAVALHLEDRTTTERIRQTIFDLPTAEFVHEGVISVFETLLYPQEPLLSGKITIWTDDYAVRIASSGIGDFRRKMPHYDRSRLSVAFDPFDKVGLLPGLMQKANESGETLLAVVDDSPGNLFRAYDLLKGGPLPFFLCLVENHENAGISSPPDVPLYQAGSINDLPLLHQAFSSERIHWALDFNGPILDRGRYTDARRAAVISLLSGKQR